MKACFYPLEISFALKGELLCAQAATLMDKRMVVVIDSWQADSMYPAGHYVRTLGTIGDKETETEVLLIENDINTSPFSPAVHACVPPLPWSVSQADLDDPNRWGVAAHSLGKQPHPPAPLPMTVKTLYALTHITATTC